MSFKNKTFKTLNCKECSEEVRVDHNSTAVTCWKCVSAQMSGRPIGMPLEEWGKILAEQKKLGPDCQDSEQ
jgi:hypothetical protein